MRTIENYLNAYFFLGFNMLVIILAETVGDGRLFFDKGIIHVIAVCFVFLTIIRIFYHYYTYDPILETFIHTSLAAMGVFAVSHIVEFVSFMVLHKYADIVYTNVANFYLMSLFLIILGAESFLRRLHGRSMFLTRFLYGGIFVLMIWSAVLLFMQNSSLSTDTVSISLLYTLATFAAIWIGLSKMHEIKRNVKFMSEFVDRLSLSIVLIGLSVLPNIYYEFVVHTLKLPEIQIVYLSHFAFYGSLSVLFLAFGGVFRWGGLLEEVAQRDLQKKDKPE